MKRLYIFLFSIFFITNVFAQTEKLAKQYLKDGEQFMQIKVNEANKVTQKPRYDKALELLLKASGNSIYKNDANLNFNIGVCYLISSERPKALPYFLLAAKKDPRVNPEILYLLGLSYQLNYKFDDAIRSYEAYRRTLKPNELEKKKVSRHITRHFRDTKILYLEIAKEIKIEGVGAQIAKRIEECEKGKELKANPTKAIIENMGSSVNSPAPEYAPVISADEAVMYFTSRRAGSTGGEISDFDGRYYEDIYVTLKIGANWVTPNNLGPPVNTDIHESAIGLSADGQTMFLYNVNTDNGGDIYISKLSGDQWSRPRRMPSGINTKDYEYTATLSADERTLYFTSSRSGGLGGIDIYSSKKLPNGRWAKPKNLGPVINTPADEDGVFFHPDGKTLFFSSKGHGTMGGYDIFKSVLDEEGNWSEPENMGYPINTPEDDIYFVLGASGAKGYYSSIHEDSEGEKDLYVIKFPKQEEQLLTLLTGKVMDDTTKEFLEATLKLEDVESGELLGEFVSNSSTGKYLIALPSGKHYSITIAKEKYLFHSEQFDIPAASKFQKVERDIYLKKIEVGTKMVLKNIFFDFGKASIREESELELSRVVDLMNLNSNMNIEISGHTDNKGNADFNKILSERRAQAVVNYLVEKGIEKERFEAKGYGDEQPVAANENEDGSDNPDGRQLNRRTEFKIIKYNTTE